MTIRRLLATITLVTVAVLTSPGAAHAAPPSGATTPVAPSANADQQAPSTTCPPTANPEPTESSVVPDDCWGRFPSSHYDIGCDEGAWNQVTRKIYCALTDLAFQSARAAVATALWLIDWAYGFRVYDRLGGLATDLAAAMQADLVGPLGLGQLAWFYAVAWAAIQALRGRLVMAGGELLVSIVLAIGAGVLLANPAGYLAGLFDTMETTSAAVLATGTGHPPPTSEVEVEQVMRPVQAAVHKAFVEDPYDYLDWGGTLTGACAAARDESLADGPHGSSDDPRDAMRAAGCDQQADFNHDPSGSRLFGAILTFGASAIVVVLFALVSMTVLVAKVFTVVLFGVMPLAALAAVLPGAGRELCWRWLAAVVRAALAVIGMSFVLALLLMSVTAMLEGSGDLGLVERFALVNVGVIAMIVARKRILAAGHGWATTLGQRLASRRAGGQRETPWLANPVVAGATGFALGSSLGLDRNSRTSRLTGAAGRNHLANRRMRLQGKAADRRADRRANQTVARERTEIRLADDGTPKSRAVVSVDGPVARSRRARRTRERVEAKAAARHAWARQGHHDTGWVTDDEPLPDSGFGGPNDEPVDVEEV
jgi:hypothetical protein